MTAWIYAGVVAVGLGSVSLAGLVVALLVRRVHPGLSLARLWLFYSGLVAFLVVVALAVALR